MSHLQLGRISRLQRLLPRGNSPSISLNAETRLRAAPASLRKLLSNDRTQNVTQCLLQRRAGPVATEPRSRQRGDINREISTGRYQRGDFALENHKGHARCVPERSRKRPTASEAFVGIIVPKPDSFNPGICHFEGGYGTDSPSRRLLCAISTTSEQPAQLNRREQRRRFGCHDFLNQLVESASSKGPEPPQTLPLLGVPRRKRAVECRVKKSDNGGVLRSEHSASLISLRRLFQH